MTSHENLAVLTTKTRRAATGNKERERKRRRLRGKMPFPSESGRKGRRQEGKREKTRREGTRRVNLIYLKFYDSASGVTSIMIL